VRATTLLETITTLPFGFGTLAIYILEVNNNLGAVEIAKLRFPNG